MWKLKKYIIKTVLSAIGIVACVLCGLYVIFAFVGEANVIGHGSYTLWQAFLYVMLMLPANLYIMLPMAGLLGSLLGLGLLASNSELVVMRAAGVSIRQIAQAVLIAACIITLITFALGSYISPKLQYKASIKKAMATESQAVLVTAKSTWLKDANDFVYIGKTMPGGHLQNVIRYHIEHSTLKNIYTAKSAFYHDNNWLLHDITQISFNKDHVIKKLHKTMVWKNLITPALLKIVMVTPDNLTLEGLSSYIQYRKQNNLSTQSYELAFYKSIFVPISVIVLMLIAVPFVFGPLRSSTTGLRLLSGIIIGFIFFIIEQFFGPFTLVYGIPPMLGAALPVIIFGGFLIWLYARI